MAKPMKYSKQREKLLEILRSTKRHPTADWLYQEMRKEFCNVSLGTVYRNLKQLIDSGDIIKLETGGSSERYDACTRNHYHFVCEQCESVSDVDMKELVSVNEAASEASGNDVKNHSLIFFGVCARCKMNQ